MSRFNQKTGSARVSNLAGGKAFAMKPKEELLHAVLTTFLSDKFYESGDDRLKRIQALIPQVGAEFAARLAVIARKEFHLRSVFHALIGETSKISTGTDLVKRAIEAGVERPDDLTEIAAYLEGKLSKQVKRGMRHAILKFSPFQIAKYRMEAKKIKLVDIFNLVHPKSQFASPEQQVAWKQLVDGELKSFDTWETRLSAGEDKKKVWHDLIFKEKIGYMALLRNLRNLEEQADEMTQDKAAAMLYDEELVRKSKQLPFRFYNAYKNVSSRRFKDAIAKAMEISVKNVPALDGETLVAVDTSGSMTMGSGREGGAIERASVLAAALIKHSSADVVLYDTRISNPSFNGLDSVITNAEKIQHLAHGGGTETSLVFRWAEKSGKKYKRIIILSDNESWNEYDVQSIYNEYRKFNDCFVYAIDIQGYGTKDVAGEKVEHLAGFSERIFDFIGVKERGVDTLLRYVEDYKL